MVQRTRPTKAGFPIHFIEEITTAMAQFRMGEWILLVSQKGKKWLVKVQEGPFSTHIGTIQMDDIPGKEEGDHLITNKDAKLFLFRPTLEEYIFNMERQTQIIYPKDLSVMIFYGDIQPGDLVLESGVGSGALSLALLKAIGDRGTLISVEKRPEFAALARKNISRYFGSHPENHKLIVGDIENFGLNQKVDRVYLDLPEPWHAVPSIAQMIRQGGLVLSLSPNVGQVQLMYRELRLNGFANVVTFELLRRDWKVDERRARPTDRMVAHSGFITIAKKTPRTFVETPAAEKPATEA